MSGPLLFLFCALLFYLLYVCARALLIIARNQVAIYKVLERIVRGSSTD